MEGREITIASNKSDDQDKIGQETALARVATAEEIQTELKTYDASSVEEKTDKQLTTKKEESINIGGQNIKIASKQIEDQDKIDQKTALARRAKPVRETRTELEIDDASSVEEKTEKQLAMKKEEIIEMGGRNTKIEPKEYDEQDNIKLGCFQGMFELLDIPQRRSINCALMIGILLIISDASGDYGLAFLMYKRGFIKEAFLILFSECLASLLAILHITRTWIRSQDSWQKILRESLFLLIFSPVMIIVTTVFWFMNRICNPTSLQNNRYHFYAKTLTVLHGTVEAPMQIVLMISFIIKGQVFEKNVSYESLCLILYF